MPDTAKLFQHGRSQAVRLPKAFRLPGKEVKVSRVGNAVLLEPIVEQKPFASEAFWDKIDALLGGEPFPEVRDEDLPADLDEAPDFDILTK